MIDKMVLRSSLAAAENALDHLIDDYVAARGRKTDEARLLLIFGGHTSTCSANFGPTCDCEWTHHKRGAQKWLKAHQDPDDKFLKIIIAGLIENQTFLKKITEIVGYRRLLQKDNS